MGILSRLTGYERKKELCLQIAKRYEEQERVEFNEAVKMPVRVSGGLSSGERDISEEYEETVSLIGVFAFLGKAHQAYKNSIEAKRYKKLANSRRLHLIRKSKLEKVLQTLPVKEKPRIYNVRKSNGKVYRLSVK